MELLQQLHYGKFPDSAFLFFSLQGNTGKLIKQMTKLEHPDVKKNAGLLIRQWKDMIRGGPGTRPKPFFFLLTFNSTFLW